MEHATPTEEPDASEPGPVDTGRSTLSRGLLWALFVLVVLMGIFVNYTAWQQRRAEEQRNELIAIIEKQNEAIICYVDATQTFQLTLADVVIAETTSPKADGDIAVARLEQARVEVVQAKTRCLGRLDSSTTTTTAPR